MAAISAATPEAPDPSGVMDKGLKKTPSATSPTS